MIRVKPIWQALGVLLVASLAGLAASHWPQQTQAIAASLGFIATVVLVYITKNYVAENQKMRRLMEEQWQEERRVHASFWLQVDPSRHLLIIPFHPGGAGWHAGTAHRPSHMELGATRVSSHPHPHRRARDTRDKGGGNEHHCRGREFTGH